MENAKEESKYAQSRLHRPFQREEALARKASLRWHLDLAHQPSVSLIETAMRSKTVAVEYSVSGLNNLNDCRNRHSDSRRDVLGCSRMEKNGSRTSKTKTVTTHSVN